MNQLSTKEKAGVCTCTCVFVLYVGQGQNLLSVESLQQKCGAFVHVHVLLLTVLLLTLGAHAQRGLQKSFCVSVCLCVYDYSRTTGYEATHELYQQLQCYKGKKYNVAILLKPPRSRDMA